MSNYFLDASQETLLRKKSSVFECLTASSKRCVNQAKNTFFSAWVTWTTSWKVEMH